MTDILKNYAQIVEVRDASTGKKKCSQVFLRHHQLGVVHQGLRHAREQWASAT